MDKSASPLLIKPFIQEDSQYGLDIRLLFVKWLYPYYVKSVYPRETLIFLEKSKTRPKIYQSTKVIWSNLCDPHFFARSGF